VTMIDIQLQKPGPVYVLPSEDTALASMPPEWDIQGEQHIVLHIVRLCYTCFKICSFIFSIKWFILHYWKHFHLVDLLNIFTPVAFSSSCYILKACFLR
jgi:hypothetical protein